MRNNQVAGTAAAVHWLVSWHGPGLSPTHPTEKDAWSGLLLGNRYLWVRMQELRIYREAWRMSRCTFFDLTNADHDSLRRQVDGIYYSSLALLLRLMVESDDDEIVVQRMAAALGAPATAADGSLQQQLSNAETNIQHDPVTRTRLISERMPAYIMARTDHSSDSEICAALNKQSQTPQARPLIRLARLGRCVPENRSSLWLQWVNLWLYPAIYPSARDPYTIAAMVAEFSVYTADPMFWRLMQQPSGLEEQILKHEPIRQFLLQVQQLDDDPATESYTQDRSDFIANQVQPFLEALCAKNIPPKLISQARRNSKTEAAWCVPAFYQVVTCALSPKQVQTNQGNSSQEGNLSAYLAEVATLAAQDEWQKT